MSDDHVPRLADFGLAQVITELTDDHPEVLVNDTASKHPGGCVRWSAPELIILDDTEHRPRSRPSPETDIYSYGMVVLEVRSKFLVWRGCGSLQQSPFSLKLVGLHWSPAL